MKIAIYAGTFKKDQDGIARSMYELVDSILEKKIEIGLFSPAITPQPERKGIKFYKLPSMPLLIYPDYKMAIPFSPISRKLDEFRPDIIHVTTPDVMGFQFIKYAEKRNIPVIGTYHTDYPSYFKYYHIDFLLKPGWKILRSFYNRCDTTFAPTRYVAAQINEKGITNTRIWSRGIDLKRFNPSHRSAKLREKWGAKNKKVILFSGRFVYYKSVDVVASIYEHFMKNGPDVVFAMVGGGPRENVLKKLMPKANFTGYLTGDDLSVAYASGDIFLFPSTTETFGNVVQEALASGLPAVVSNVGGCMEIVEESNGGFVAEANNVNAFYDKCRILIENEKIYKEKKKNGIAYARGKSWHDINKIIIDRYKELYNNKKKNNADQE